MSIENSVKELGRQAREASRIVAASTVAARNQALLAIRDSIADNRNDLLSANAQDLAAGVKSELAPALLDRLELNAERIASLMVSLEQVAALPDPVGAIDGVRTMDSGIRVGKMRVPLGVIGIIYESRPNVTVEAASLCLKAGNAAILRGGSEAINSNLALGRCIQEGLASAGLPAATTQVVATTDRAVVDALIRLSGYVDMVIPRLSLIHI